MIVYNFKIISIKIDRVQNKFQILIIWNFKIRYLQKRIYNRNGKILIIKFNITYRIIMKVLETVHKITKKVNYPFNFQNNIKI